MDSAAAPDAAGATGGRRKALVALQVLAVALLCWLAFAGPLDQRAETAVESGLQRALVTFAIVRGLNAVISAAQGTELALAPAGVGVTLTPGEVLDPVNDLIERFSEVMLVAAASLGVQRVLVELSGWWPISLLLSGGFAVFLWLSWRRRWPRVHRWLLQALVLLAVLRFALPLTVIGSEYFYGLFLAERHQQSESRMAEARDQVEEINRDATAQAAPGSATGEDAEAGWMARGRQWLRTAGERWSPAATMDRYQQAVAETVNDAVELMVVFLLHTLLLPLGLLWAIVLLARRLLG